MNEILLIAAIVLALIFIPRLNASRKTGRPGFPTYVKSGFALSGRQRIAILASLVWIAFWAVYYEPWQREWKLFAYIGAGPVVLAWGVIWAFKGAQRKPNR